MRKKAKILLLTSFTVAVMALSGCGKQKVDYNLDEGNQSAGDLDEIAEGAIAERLGIPKSYYGNINVGDSGLIEIKIQAEDIQVPSTDSMKIEYLKGNRMDAEYRQRITELLFNRSNGIYQYGNDWNGDGITSKHDIEQRIKIKEMHLNYAYEVGDTEWITEFEKQLSDLQQEYEEATGEHEPPGDWTATEYIGDVNDIQFRVVFSPFDEVFGYFAYYMSFNMAEMVYRPHKGMMYVDYMLVDDEEVENQCSWSKEEAIEIAEEFLFNCGISDVALLRAEDLGWYYTTLHQLYLSDATIEVDGYWIEFVRAVDGNAVYHEYTYADTLNYPESQVYERYEVYIDDNGILEVFCYDMFRPTGEVEENVDLLSWNEVIEIAGTIIPEYYTEHTTAYDRITFNEIHLTYYLVNGNEENSYKYIPVWVFEEKEEGYDITQVIMIDAVTGELVDINERRFEDVEVGEEKHY